MGKYSRAPIVEAVIDVRALMNEKFGLTDLKAFQEAEPGYPERKGMQIGSATLTIGEKPSYQTETADIGFQFWSADKRQVVQVRKDGFTFSRLAPYTDWEIFSAEAFRLLERYREIARPERIDRVAVRYINRLDLRSPADLTLYLKTAPEIAPGLPQGLGNWFMHLEIPDGDKTIVINETRLPSVVPDTVAVLFDIDVFQTQNLPQDERALRALFEEMRKRKNTVFEQSITERLRQEIS